MSTLIRAMANRSENNLTAPSFIFRNSRTESRCSVPCWQRPTANLRLSLRPRASSSRWRPAARSLLPPYKQATRANSPPWNTSVCAVWPVSCRAASPTPPSCPSTWSSVVCKSILLNTRTWSTASKLHWPRMESRVSLRDGRRPSSVTPPRGSASLVSMKCSR